MWKRFTRKVRNTGQVFRIRKISKTYTTLHPASLGHICKETMNRNPENTEEPIDLHLKLQSPPPNPPPDRLQTNTPNVDGRSVVS